MTLQFSPSCKLKIVCAIFVIWRRGPTKLWKPSKAVTVAVDVIVVAVVVVVAAVVVVVVVIVGGSVFGFAALDNPRNGFQLFNWNEFIKKVWFRQPETQTPITSSIFETFESTHSAFSLLLNLIMMIRLTLTHWQAATWDVESRGNSQINQLCHTKETFSLRIVKFTRKPQFLWCTCSSKRQFCVFHVPARIWTHDIVLRC